MWFCSQLCSRFCHMVAATDSSLCVGVTHVSVCKSPVQLVRNILPHFQMPGKSRALSSRHWELPSAPCDGEVTETRCLIPLLGLVAPGHQMGKGIYSFPSLFFGLSWMELQALSPHRPVNVSVDKICCSAALLFSPRRAHSTSCLLGWTIMCHKHTGQKNRILLPALSW